MANQTLGDFIEALNNPDLVFTDTDVSGCEFLICDAEGNQYTKVLSVYSVGSTICIDVE